ncbi:uncharacterized protein BDZ99DRAFT_467102 [Mytilinidion resinicola]|uniref:Uncharacterized protein n=1 Tax=Mytilinidion resinicola TaxID=574789 RepID=A0A6A6YA33_9PEZI|nr:uncharacterized protein BDZ99DRAFT_467102 [Mytilinidion resinicola]KAF2804854.1 hypothetical protein BDZ99DRAFT_467102 [Mytilinidion resinicola]
MAVPETSTAQLDDATAEPKTGFMGLSGELRNFIYRLALVSKDPLLVYLDIDPEPEREETPEHLPTQHATERPSMFTNGRINIARPKPKPLDNPPTVALLQVSRQVRREARSIYYAENLFTIHNDFTKFYINSKLEETRQIERFRAWQIDLGDSLQWIKRLHVCTYKFIGAELVPYVMFATEHPDVSIEVSSMHGACARCEEDRTEPPELVPLAEKLAILKSPGWIEELQAGNIEEMCIWRHRDNPTRVPPHGAHYTIVGPRWYYRVVKVSYGIEASRRIKGARKWQELCEKLSQHYEFTLEPLKLRKGPSYLMKVAPRHRSER